MAKGGVVSSYGSTLAPQNQMVSLDLAVPWQANAPAWSLLKPGPTLSKHSAIVSADEQTFVTFGSSASGSSYLTTKYHIASNSWEPSAVKVQDPTKEGLQAVEDQASGLVYLAGGFQSDDSQMYVYNVDYDSISKFPMPSDYMEDRKDYAAVYLKSRKSILYFGGSTSSSSSSGGGSGGGQISADLVTEFIPSTGSWTTLNIHSQNPPHRTDFCMVANDDGSKVVVFGGRLDNGGYAKDLWVLDVATLTWTQGPSWVEPRMSTTCTVAGSMFIAWGGSNGLWTVDGTAILYDLDHGQYVSAYVPPPSYASSNGGEGVQSRSPAGNPDHANGNADVSTDERSKSNAMLVVGGIIGAVFLLACLILVTVFMRKHRKQIQSQCISGHYSSYDASNLPRPSTSNSFATLPVCAAPPARDALTTDEEKQISPVLPPYPSTAA
ncbi:hypothetical protein BGZ75_002084 [Mortierella antarctica]|nr:hypothetical protein BGZ75_002084 [Mortierella antarctica]